MQPMERYTEQRRILLDLVKDIAEEQKYGGYEINIEEVSYGAANATSAIFAVKLTQPEKEDLRLFVKTLVKRGPDNVVAGSRWFFTNERYFYSTVKQQFQRMEELHNLPKEHRLMTPKFYASHNVFPCETLVLEDLTAVGFKSFEREKSINMEQAITAIEVLAKFHALSLACYNEDPQGCEDTLQQLAPKTAFFESMIQTMKPKSLATVYEVCTTENRGSMEKFFNDRDRFSEFAKTFYGKKNRGVLAHGDFKHSNLMYRRRDSKLEMALTDFQFVGNLSPVSDLMYFLVTSADEQFRRQHYHALLDRYYEQLKLALGRLHVDPEEAYSEKSYREEIEELATAGLMLGVVWLPMLLAEDDYMDVWQGSTRVTDFVAPPSALYRERLNGIVNNYREWGLLE